LEVKLCIMMIAATAAIAQTPEATFQARCATCHSAGNAMGAPLPETLRKMSSKAILAALDTGRQLPPSRDVPDHRVPTDIQTHNGTAGPTPPTRAS
jgi:mono/diheme cytochrome c family protein